MKYCLTVDLKNDSDLIKEYEKYHENIWPEIKDSILKAGIKHMEIYRVENRLCMIMEVDETFSFEKKQAADEANSKVQNGKRLCGNTSRHCLLQSLEKSGY